MADHKAEKCDKFHFVLADPVSLLQVLPEGSETYDYYTSRPGRELPNQFGVNTREI